MTPAQIAAALTEAQVRALKDPEGCETDEWFELAGFCGKHDLALLDFVTSTATDLGRAVLAELENRHD